MAPQPHVYPHSIPGVSVSRQRAHTHGPGQGIGGASLTLRKVGCKEGGPWSSFLRGTELRRVKSRSRSLRIPLTVDLLLKVRRVAHVVLKSSAFSTLVQALGLQAESSRNPFSLNREQNSWEKRLEDGYPEDSSPAPAACRIQQ